MSIRVASLISSLAATLALLCGLQASMPSPASAFVAECVDATNCQEGSPSGSDENGGGDDQADSPGDADDDPCNPISNCLGGMGDQGPSDDPDGACSDADPGACQSTDPSNDAAPSNGAPAPIRPRISPCDAYFDAWALSVSPDGTMTAGEQAALDALTRCEEDTRKGVIVAQSDDPPGDRRDSTHANGARLTAKAGRRSKQHGDKRHSG